MAEAETSQSGSVCPAAKERYVTPALFDHFGSLASILGLLIGMPAVLATL
jgi:hypothetical protein